MDLPLLVYTYTRLELELFGMTSYGMFLGLFMVVTVMLAFAHWLIDQPPQLSSFLAFCRSSRVFFLQEVRDSIRCCIKTQSFGVSSH